MGVNSYEIQCYTHGGARQGTPCQDAYCVMLAAKYEATKGDWAVNPPLFAAVPGGNNQNIDYHRDSQAGMEEYRESKATGLRTGSIKKGGTEKYEKQRESQQRAVDRLSEGMDTSTLTTVDGVEHNA